MVCLSPCFPISSPAGSTYIVKGRSPVTETTLYHTFKNSIPCVHFLNKSCHISNLWHLTQNEMEYGTFGNEHGKGLF